MRTLVCVVSFLLAACASETLSPPPQETSESTTSPSPGFEAELEVNIDSLDTKLPIVFGATNLPDGTSLLVSVSQHLGFRGQDRVAVRGGAYRAGPFGPAGGLPPGDYTVEVTMEPPSVQPDEVVAVIGTYGENLSGPLVQEVLAGSIVSAKEEFSVGDGAAAPGAN